MSTAQARMHGCFQAWGAKPRWAGAVLAKIAVLVFLIVFIQKRPQGIFAIKGRSAEA